YQTVHVRRLRPLLLPQHLALLAEHIRALFGYDLRPDPQRFERRIAALLETARQPAKVSSFVRIEATTAEELRLVLSAPSLYDGYALRSLRPQAAPLRYEIPFGDRPTSLRLETLRWARELVRAAGAATVIRCDRRDLVRAADDAPLFAVLGERIYTPPAPPSIERDQALRAIDAARLGVTEQEIGREQLAWFDELFYFDHRGITSLSGCGEALYTDIIAARIARTLPLILRQ
ncbi:MAG: aminotransferase class IV, partial [Alistipes sp.]|nr:aminotransferase class IV [Alistipes sp.]